MTCLPLTTWQAKSPEVFVKKNSARNFRNVFEKTNKQTNKQTKTKQNKTKTQGYESAFRLWTLISSTKPHTNPTQK